MDYFQHRKITVDFLSRFTAGAEDFVSLLELQARTIGNGMQEREKPQRMLTKTALIEVLNSYGISVSKGRTVDRWIAQHEKLGFPAGQVDKQRPGCPQVRPEEEVIRYLNEYTKRERQRTARTV